MTDSPVAASSTDGAATGSGSSPAPTSAGSAPVTTAEPAGTTPSAVATIGPPTRILVPVLGVDAPVDGVLNQGGVLDPPDDPSRVGWWISSPPAGASAGSTVVVGHVDSAADGPGAFYSLAELPAGSEISVVTAGGGTVGYRVKAREVYTKSESLPAGLFAFDGPPRLVLITCGGEFDRDTGSYEENVVVIAEPVF
ncbi:class F sortase [Nakamurella sp. GG22]